MRRSAQVANGEDHQIAGRISADQIDAVAELAEIRASNRPVIVPVGLENGESAKRVRRRDQVQNVTKKG
jgi:hypothetical protein